MLNHWSDKDATLFAIRVSSSVILTWLICLQLSTTATSAAMISIIIILVSGSNGAGLIKAFARAIGTVLGCAFVLFVASFSLIDSWLFNIYLIIWIVLCIGLAGSFPNSSTGYMFGMAGMTASIVGFPLSFSPEIVSAFNSVQARCFGILIAIAISVITTTILPYQDDIKRLIPIKRATLKFISLIFSNNNHQESQRGLSQYLALLGRNKQLPIDSLVGSKASLEQIKSQRDSLFYCVSIVIASFKINRMLKELETPTTREQLISVIDKIQKQGEQNKEGLIRQISLPNNPMQAKILQHSLSILVDNLIWLNSNKIEITSTTFTMQITQFFNHNDFKTLFRNMLRASLLLLTISYFWIESQWSSGMNAMLITGIMCSMNATSPNADIGNIVALKSQLITIVISFTITFGIMPIAPPQIFFTVMFLYLLVVSYEFIACRTANKLIWMFMLIYWSSYVPLTNVPSFDFNSYINNATANIFAITLIIVFYKLVPQRQDSDIILDTLRRSLKKIKKNNYFYPENYVKSDFILSAYPVLMSQSHTKPYLNRILSLNACLRLNELSLLDDSERVIIQNLADSLIHGGLVEKPLYQLQQIARKNMDNYQDSDNYEAYSLWWQLSSALSQLNKY
ncbi:FUSC family protein [Vibrio sp. SS-MA-C1-2]|uniref:FUSC family protein n=1 Tax=Vibrio sp. SS-MA-C1-2 TaxID=2908646 RepID=UPI001F2F61E1|nr:FUSC family protein [Vibrio sp. SS-MA-C1-2]UJF19278.1 FUSC family protein [Vibrio sp. SS-MA-C1-2]